MFSERITFQGGVGVVLIAVGIIIFNIPLSWNRFEMSETSYDTNYEKRVVIVNGIPCYAPDLMGNNEYYSGVHQMLLDQEERYFWFTSRRKLLLHLVGRWASPVGTFCEMGCGNAQEIHAISTMYPWIALYGCDIHIEPLKAASKKMSGCSFFQADLQDFQHGYTFDTIGLFDVLEHIEDDTTALLSVHQCLNEGGKLILSVPQYQWLWGVQDNLAKHKRRYSRADLRTKLVEAGFRIRRLSSYMVLLLPLMIWSRFLSKKKGARTANLISDEFNLPPLLNRILGAITDFEVRLTAMGVSFPMGGSIVCVAEKEEQKRCGDLSGNTVRKGITG